MAKERQGVSSIDIFKITIYNMPIIRMINNYSYGMFN